MPSRKLSGRLFVKKVVSEVWETEDGSKFDTKEEALNHASKADFLSDINKLLSTGLSAPLTHDTETLIKDFLWNYKAQLLPIFVSYGVENLLTDEEDDNDSSIKETPATLCTNCGSPDTKETFPYLNRYKDDESDLEIFRVCAACDHDWLVERYDVDALIDCYKKDQEFFSICPSCGR